MFFSHKRLICINMDGSINVAEKQSSSPLAFSMSSSSDLPSPVSLQMTPQKGNQSFYSEAAQYGNMALPGGPMMALKLFWK